MPLIVTPNCHDARFRTYCASLRRKKSEVRILSAAPLPFSLLAPLNLQLCAAKLSRGLSRGTPDQETPWPLPGVLLCATRKDQLPARLTRQGGLS